LIQIRKIDYLVKDVFESMHRYLFKCINSKKNSNKKIVTTSFDLPYRWGRSSGRVWVSVNKNMLLLNFLRGIIFRNKRRRIHLLHGVVDRLIDNPLKRRIKKAWEITSISCVSFKTDTIAKEIIYIRVRKNIIGRCWNETKQYRFN